MRLSKGDVFSVVVRMETPTYDFPIAVEAYTPDPEMPDAVPVHMGKDANGNEEASFVSADGKNWIDPKGYGQDIASNVTTAPEDSPTIGASGDGLEGDSEGSNERISGRDRYVTNVCVKALTIPASQLVEEPNDLANAGGSKDQVSTDPYFGSPAGGSGLAATGDGMALAIAALALLAALAALALASRRRMSR